MEMKKVAKAFAKKLYDEGFGIMFIPNRCNPKTRWDLGCYMDKSSGKSFDELVSLVLKYNCNNVNGLACSFYVRSLEYDRTSKCYIKR